MKNDKIKKNITTIDEGARRYLDITRDEYALCQYIQFRAADPRQRVPGRCCDPKESIADFVGITRAGLYKMIDKLAGYNLLDIEPATGAISVSAVWMDTMSVNKVDTLQDKVVNLVDSDCKQSLQSSVNKVTHNIEVKEEYSKSNNTVGSNAPTEFDELWNKYNFKRGSKKKALDLYLKLSEKDRQSLHLALPAYLADSVTQQVPGAPFKPMRRHLQFFISGRVWESYLDQIQESKAEDQQTPYDEQYAAYLDYCRKKYPAVLDAIRHLSKKQFVEYKEQNYHSSLHRLGQKMQVNEFLRSHTHFQDGHPGTLKHPNVWEYHKVRLNQLIQSAFNV